MIDTYANLADTRQATTTECLAWEDVFTFLDIFKEDAPDAFLAMIAPQTHIRMTRRLQYIYMLGMGKIR